jgi:F-type H+-transporting ATPase subunit gamma
VLIVEQTLAAALWEKRQYFTQFRVLLLRSRRCRMQGVRAVGLSSVRRVYAAARAHVQSSTPGGGGGGGGGVGNFLSSSNEKALGGVRFASLKAVRNRMRSIASIGKITKAMKMVAAAKLRGTQARQDLSRPFAASVRQFFDLLPLEKLGSETKAGVAEPKRRLLVVITSDRGLCGSVNTNVCRLARQMLPHGAASPVSDGVETNIMVIGDKGRDALQRTSAAFFTTTFRDVFKAPVSFPQAVIIAEEILAQSPDEVVIFYNRFKSAISQVPTQQPLLGLQLLMDNASVFDGYEFDSDMDSSQVMVDLFEFEVATQLYGALLENATSEQAARMSAMDNASTNAAEMLDKLTLQYNRERQAVITTELVEIVAGASALQK